MQQNIDYYDHPVFHPYDLIIRTPAIQLLEDQLTQLLWNGITGAVIQGQARHGKTTALDYIRDNLKNRRGEIIPSHFLTVPTLDRKTVNALYRTLLVSVDLPVTNTMRVEPMLNNLLCYILDSLAEKKSRQFIIFADEAQRLSPEQCGVFCQIYDILREKYKIQLHVFLVVNSDEAESLLHVIRKKQYRHIHGRFFINIYNFYGLRNKADVKACLAQYDSLRFPKEDGPVYTEFFLPQAFNDNWRLSDAASLLWGTFTRYQKAYQIDSWGMQYFISMVNVLLTDFLPHYGVDHLSEEMVERALDATGFVPENIKAV
ncbi:MAG: hypothetical protein ACI90U_002664 [Pseudomonadales bacterium]|jgi:hypothetical protein